MFEVAFEELSEADLQLGLAITLAIGICAIAFKVVPLISHSIFNQLQVLAAIYRDIVEFIGLPDGTFGHVESIGLRSTKLRSAAKSTLVIIPNSTMANLDIENIT